MAYSKAATVEEYLGELAAERRQTVEAVRTVILDNLPAGYEEAMQFGMISYVIPLKRYPKTYNGQALSYAALASQKNYVSVYLMNIYGDAETERWFTGRYKASGKRLDMGKSCVRFKKLDDLPLDLIAEAVALTSVESYIQLYEESRARSR